jgi:hypothetical protein
MTRPPLSLTLAILLTPVARASDSALTVGFGEADVSPEIGKKPVFLAGFGENRRATKVHDPIMARAVVLSDGRDKIGLVSVDVVGLFLPSVENVRKQLPEFKYVLVSSTHNHEGPDTLGLWGPNPFTSGIDPEYLKRVERGAADAVRRAEKAATSARAEIGTATAPELLHDGRRPYVKHDELVVLRFTGTDDKPLGLLVQWNCHPETLDSRNTEVSADYVYYTVKALREKHVCPVAYFTGTVGGLMTSLNVPLKDDKGNELKDGTFEKTERYGVAVAEVTNAALKSAKPVRLTPFTLRTRQFLMPVDNGLYRVAWQVGKLRRPLYLWDGKPVPEKFVEAKNLEKPVAVRSEVGFLSLGELDVAVIPGEIYPELVLAKAQDPPDPGADFPDAPVEPAVYSQMKARHKMLVGLGNDELGYIIPKRQWDEQKPYCYGLKKSQYGEINSVGPDAAPILCGVFRDLAAGK